MIVHAILFLLSAMLAAFALLYFVLFVKERKRKLIDYDPAYEKIRGKNYPPPYPNGW